MVDKYVYMFFVHRINLMYLLKIVSCCQHFFFFFFTVFQQNIKSESVIYFSFEGRQEGRSGWGIHVNPWLIHVNVWQKPLQYCKVISLQPIKINGKKIVFLVCTNIESLQKYVLPPSICYCYTQFSFSMFCLEE